MTYEEIKKFVAENIRYRDWEFHVKTTMKGGILFGIYLQIQFLAVCNSRCECKGSVGLCFCQRERQYCRKWQLSENMTPTEIVRTCWKAVQAAVEHEAAEEFKFRGISIYNPHIDVERIWWIATGHDARKEKE